MGQQLTPQRLYALIEQQAFTCALTGRALTPENAVIDHKTPLSRGGTNDMSNLQWITEAVNTMKGRMGNEEFIALCEAIVAHRDAIMCGTE